MIQLQVLTREPYDAIIRQTRIVRRSTTAQKAPGLEEELSQAARALQQALRSVLGRLDDGRQGPQVLGQALRMNTVFASRLLKAARQHDPLALVYHLPGAEPMRRFARAARRLGASPTEVQHLQTAVEHLENLIRNKIGDRSALDTLLSSWLPEARAEFEARRRQAVFKSLSELKGVRAETLLGTVLLHPSSDPDRIDVVWILGFFGLRRLRPGATAKLSSRRFAPENGGRMPRSLSGQAVEDLDGLRLDDFCQATPAPLDVRRAGEVVHYVLGGDRVGLDSAVDLLLAETNFAEMKRFVPAGSGRKRHVFAEVSTPARTLLFDVLVHREVQAGGPPQLHLYDTAFEGVADANDPARDLDRFWTTDQIDDLGFGSSALRTQHVPNYLDLLGHVFAKLDWRAADFRTWRCAMSYPLYGTQVTVAFEAPERGA